MARSRYNIFDTSQPYFLTCTVVQWLKLFDNKDLRKVIVDSLNFITKHHRLQIYAYVIMPNHLHLIALSEQLSKEIASFKSFTARNIIDTLKSQNENRILQILAECKLKFKHDRTYQIWQEGSHPQEIQNETMMHQKIEYIHYNPVRAGCIEEPLEWTYSSARDYNGIKGPIEVKTEW